MSLKKPEVGARNPLKRGRVVHLPSVKPDCYLETHSLEVGNYRDCLSKLSKAKNWGDLRRMLQPVADLVVKDSLGQYFVDDVRHQFNRAMAFSTRSNGPRPFVTAVMTEKGDGDVEALKLLLAVGLDPDLPCARRNNRPSHWCGVMARLDLAGLIFHCRPCMNAVTKDGHTPLQAASDRVNYQGDAKHLERKFLRRKVKNYIEAGGFETRFPSLPELAIEKSWFAIKNLLRRQVVTAAEFTEKFEGKTAAGWAEFFNELGMAAEIRYYARAPSARLHETAKLAAAMVEVICDNEDEASVQSSKIMKLEQEVKELKNEAVTNKAKIKELSEAVIVYRAKLEEAGDGSELNEANSLNIVSESGEMSVDSGCDLKSAGATSSSNI